MLVLLRRTVLLLLLLLSGAAACAEIDAVEFRGDLDVLLAEGERWGERLQRRDADELTDSEVLALGYLERGRLGLGSPFRLIDYALRDPALAPDDRGRVAYALLEMTLDRRGYQVRPAVLDAARLQGVAPAVPVGEHHLRLIEQTIRGAPSAASGERAVRLGYALAAAEQTVAPAAAPLVAHVGALAGDRRRAREDASRLLHAAAATDADPLALLPQWRREQRFRVEAPAMAGAGAVEEIAEASRGPRLALALRALAQRLGAPLTLMPHADRTSRPEPSYLTPAVAERLLALSVLHDYPAQAPVTVAVHVHRDALLNRPDLPDWQVQARGAFAEAAYNEMRLIGAATRLRDQVTAAGTRLDLVELQAATYLRAWNQEEPWFPGDPAPSPRNLEDRFGLARVSVDEQVPERWRPYYLRMVGRALTDLQRTLPAVSLRGLRIRIGPLPSEVDALAMHDPHSRTLYFPPRTGAGALAHELAHDLDWQLARQRYGASRGYATDLAVQHRPGDRIATAVVDLASALARPGADSILDPHDTRPAEVFARGADWFVAAALAREGRTSGYLTSYQSSVLTGYGTTRNPDVGGGAVPSLLGILDAIAPVAEGTRQWALAVYGPQRPLSALELASAVLRAGQGQHAGARLVAIGEARDVGLATVAGEACRAASAPLLRELYATQRDLIRTAAGAAARGAVVEEVQAMARAHGGQRAERRVAQWLAWRLYGAPEPARLPEEHLLPAYEQLLLRAAALEQPGPEPQLADAFNPRLTVRLCGGNLFAPRAPLLASPAR